MKMAKIVTSEAYRFIFDCFKAVGVGPKPAKEQTSILIEADRRGHPSHGLNRLELYLNDILYENCQPNNRPKIIKESPSTAVVDACNVFGSTASNFSMGIAIRKARETGVGWVTVKMSNHFGMAGIWARQASDKGYIGLAFTNTSPLMAPTRSKKSALGTNPLAVAAPGSCDETFYLDMATTAAALGKIEIQRLKGEPLPNGWAQGPDGKETTDAEIAYNTRCLKPLGGGERNSGYKGYGLAAMVEVFCGISSGANYSNHVRAWTSKQKGVPANLGHCFAAVDPGCFAPGFGDRLANVMELWRKLEPTDRRLPVLALGDKEKKSAEEVDRRGYLTYVAKQIDSSKKLAAKLKVKPMDVIRE